MPAPIIRKNIKKLLHSHPSLLDWCRKTRDRMEWNRPASRTPHGFLIRGPEAMQTGAFESEEVDFIKSRSSEFEVFVNVGANVGYFALLAAGLGKRVVAIEASPLNSTRLLENIALNGFTGIEVFPVACGAAPDVMSLYGHGVVASLVPGWSGSSRKSATRVPVHTLDRLALEPMAGQKSLVLIDVEGFELEVLKGAASCLALEPRPVWFVEICLTEHQPDPAAALERFRQVFELFDAAGYSAKVLDEGLRNVGLDEIMDDQRVRAFANARNFIFD